MAAVLPVAHEGVCILVAFVLCGVGIAVMLLGVRLRRKRRELWFVPLQPADGREREREVASAR